MDEKKIATAGLDYLLKLRITASSFTLAAGIAVFALGFKTNRLLENDRIRVSDTASGIKLDSKALLNLTRTSIVMSASFVVNTLFLIVFLARRWHHPNPPHHGSLLQKARTIVKLVMDGQFFVVCAVFSLMFTLVSNASTKFEPAPRTLQSRLALGIPARYIENRYIMASVGTAWTLAFGYLVGFILEVWMIVRRKRFQQVIFVEN